MWNQQVVVDNRAGASSTIAAEFVARQPADGLTLFLSTCPATVISAFRIWLWVESPIGSTLTISR